MNIRKIFLLLVLVLFLAGITYASNITDDTNSGEIQKIEKTSSNIIKENNINTKTKNTKKQNTTNKNIKTSSKSYDINNYNELKNALTSKNYDNITVNIKSNILLTNNTTVNEAIKTLKINGNNKTIDGNQKYQFLKITNGQVNINHLNIKNCKTDSDGGAIYNWEGTLTVTHCNFTNNKAESWGGAIENSDGTLTVTNCNFINNTAYDRGAIGNGGDSGDAKVTHCNFTNNTANRNGGAVSSLMASSFVVSYCEFTNNKAEDNGGAIATFWDYDPFDVNYCNFTNNTANGKYGEGDGGAIYNQYSTVNVMNCNFTNNKANRDGGAINNNDGTLKVTHCNLTTNTADAGSAINSYIDSYSSHHIIISNNNFNSNIAKTKGSAIIVKGKNNKISNNAGASTSACSSTIDITGNNTIITNNTFKGKQINNTILTLNYKGSMIYGGKINITGQLTSNKTALPGCSIKITINNQQTTTVKTDNKGNYQYTFKINETGTNKITAIYNGNNSYATSTATKTFQIKKIPTKITIKNIKGSMIYGEKINITGQLTSNKTALPGCSIKITINNQQTTTVKTDNKGYYQYTFKTNKIGTNKITATYNGNNNYATSTATKTFQIKKIPTKITIIKITQKNPKDNLTIMGKFTSQTGKALINTQLKLKINNKTITTKTNNNGIFTYTFKGNKNKLNKVKISYETNSKYNYAKTSTTKTFNQTTKLALEKIPNKKINNKITIKGTFKSITGKKLINTKLKININNKKTITIKTNNKGQFKYSFKATQTGTNKITVTYNENSKYAYAPNSNTKYFKVNN